MLESGLLGAERGAFDQLVVRVLEPTVVEPRWRLIEHCNANRGRDRPTAVGARDGVGVRAVGGTIRRPFDLACGVLGSGYSCFRGELKVSSNLGNQAKAQTAMGGRPTTT